MQKTRRVCISPILRDKDALRRNAIKITSEWALLKKIRKLIDENQLFKCESIISAIGDDCAVVKASRNTRSLLTADISIEGVHFSRVYFSSYDIGWKAMTANLSDVAAMGGTPLFALVSLGISPEMGEEYILEMYRGIIDAASDARTRVVGGDISRADSLVISIALYGESEEGLEKYRSGAREGENLYVTGSLGGSLAGLELLQQGIVDSKYEHLYEKHLRPRARHNIVYDVITQFSPTSMIDVSDGLVSDVRHLCEESGVGVRLFGDSIPLCEGLDVYAKTKGKSPLEYALSSGEEYELLFTSKKRLVDTIHLYINEVPVRLIGEMSAGGCTIIINGIEQELQEYGYDHFAL